MCFLAVSVMLCRLAINELLIRYTLMEIFNMNTSHGEFAAPRIALVHNTDPQFRKNSWVSTVRNIKHALMRHVGTVDDMGPTPISLLPYRIARRLVRLSTGRNYSFHQDRRLARRMAAYFEPQLAMKLHDLVFAPNESSIVSALDTDLPLILLMDATWHLLSDYYGDYSRPLKHTLRDAAAIERRALERADLVIVPTEWAARSAIDVYGTPPEKILTAPFGANFSTAAPSAASARPRDLHGTIHLLFVGVRWEAKGGPIALDAMRVLRDRGVDAELTVVGCTPPRDVTHAHVHVFPFLDTADADDRLQFARIWERSHVFVLPTRYEAAAIVFSEASAHGIPSIATNTGGVPSIVRAGVNGLTLPYDAEGDEYAAAIQDLIQDQGRYQELCCSARVEFETRLNWDAWGTSVHDATMELLEGKIVRGNLMS